MHKTRIDLDKKARKDVSTLLAARLADTQDLYYQLKHAHWTVRGPDFLSVHELFDKIAGQVDKHMDDLAERQATLGGIVMGTLAAADKGTTLAAYDPALVSVRDHLDAVATALAGYGTKIRAAIESADKAGDAGTADLFTNISRSIDKSLWFVEAHLQSAN